MLMVPESINSKYRFKKQIGHGGIASVYLLENKENQNEKTVLKSIFTGDLNKEQIDTINKEIKYLTKFSKYENSVKLIESINEDNNIFILMEYCDMNLEQYVKERFKEENPLTINEIRNILFNLNNILKILYRNHIAHRDLKPSNILLKFIEKNNFIVKLSDYGNTKNIINSSKLQSNFKGTAIFKATEIIQNENEYNAITADLWCIGILIYFMLKGDYPFNNEYEIMNNKKKLKFLSIMIKI